MMLKETLATAKNCTGCMACVDACGKGALMKTLEPDGHIYASFDSNKCVECHRCEKVCPVIAPEEYGSNRVVDTKIYSSYCQTSDIYKYSASGGVFAALAYTVIENGGYVAGAIIENNIVSHIVTNKTDDIPKMQGSKYQQSHLNGIYREITNLIRNGKQVLFCGMGCQVGALKQYFAGKPYEENLITVDMICGGVPSANLVKTFLSKFDEDIEILNYRDKGKYVLTIKDSKGVRQFGDCRNLPVTGFSSELTNRYSCGNCQFVGITRKSDITIGDHWGTSYNDGHHHSIVLTHSLKGEHILHNCNILQNETTRIEFILNNYRCVIGRNYLNHRLQRKLMPWVFRNLSTKNIEGFYGVSYMHPIWLTLKVYNKIWNTIQAKVIRFELKKILKQLNNV